MHPGRIIGALVGVVMLASLLLLPFSNVNGGPGTQPATLWNIFVSFVNTLGSTQTSPVSGFINLAFIYQIAAILIVVGSLVGIYPVASGVMGVIGLSFVTFGPYEISTTYAANPVTFGLGFYVMWVASVLELVLAYWTWRGERKTVTDKQLAAVRSAEVWSAGAAPRKVAPKQTKGAKTTDPSLMPIVCPTCGTANPPNAIVCKKCAAPL
ncbi:MAG TPA: zinc ribbon domain-containing protein [Nitrososphaerales archaeon]|nr:zinc ribbon domain-containing protein [Nitrososphaerales archaeon]